MEVTVDLRRWLLDDLGESVGRLQGQVFDCIPLDRRNERANGGGSSVDWLTFHVTRHAALALAVLQGDSALVGAGDHTGGGAGLDEAEPGWASELDSATVGADAIAIFGRVHAFLEHLDLTRLEEVPDVERALEEAGVEREGYRWLYAAWTGKPMTFFVRWPLLGHLTNHVGEMIAIRNRMGFSPF